LFSARGKLIVSDLTIVPIIIIIICGVKDRSKAMEGLHQQGIGYGYEAKKSEHLGRVQTANNRQDALS
jgi:hypothetical protein